MSKNIECEERIMLSKQQYETILSFYKNNYDFKEKDILNFYFDDNEKTLTKNGTVLRVRSTNKIRYTITLKSHGLGGTSIELNETISKEEFDALIEDGKLPKGNIHDNVKKITKNYVKLKYFACLHCLRTSISMENYLVEIDDNNYLNINDFDLEIEAENMEIAKEKMLAICEQFSLIYSPNYIVKSKRVFNAIEHASQQRDHK